MACNSVAVSSATVSNLVLDQTELKNLLSIITGKPVAEIYYYQYQASRGKSTLRNDHSEVQVDVNGISIVLDQNIVDGSGKLTLRLTGSSSLAQAISKLKPELESKLAAAQVIAQQRTVLKRLSELGKLSNVQQVKGGVTAKLTLTL